MAEVQGSVNNHYNKTISKEVLLGFQDIGHAEWQRGQCNKESSCGLADNLESDCVTKKDGLGWEVRRGQFKRIMTHLFLVILPSKIYYDCSLLWKCCHVPGLTEGKNTWEQTEGGNLKKKERKKHKFSQTLPTSGQRYRELICLTCFPPLPFLSSIKK